MVKTKVNKTQLNAYDEAEREDPQIHRDQFAHWLRWQYVMKRHRLKLTEMKVLDVGCGTAALLRTMYRNKLCPKSYYGVDIRKNVIKEMQTSTEDRQLVNLRKRLGDELKFDAVNLVNDDLSDLEAYEPDAVTFFEVIEHVNKPAGIEMLDKLKPLVKGDCLFYLSTPCYNGDETVEEEIGPEGNTSDETKKQLTGSHAGNHIYEWKYEELKEELEKRFEIVDVFGTFCSKGDVYPNLTEAETEVYDKLKEYYDTNVLSVVFAPLYPELSRNCLWVCKAKDDGQDEVEDTEETSEPEEKAEEKPKKKKIVRRAAF